MTLGKVFPAIVVVAAAVAVSVGFIVLDDEERVSLSQVPAAVRVTIQQHAAGATIKEIERSTENGKTIYEVEIAKNGVTSEFKVAANGAFLGQEREEKGEEGERKITWGQAPPAVQAAIRKVAGGNPIHEMVRETEDGIVVYEAEYAVNGVEHSVTCSAGGEIIELEQQVAASRLPPAVQAAIHHRFPGASIQEAGAVQLFFYEAELVKNGKKFEVKVLASGEIKKSEEEGEEEGHDDD